MPKAWRVSMELQAGMTEAEVVGVDKDKNQLHRFWW